MSKRQPNPRNHGQPTRRRRRGNDASSNQENIAELAQLIALGRKVVFVTGAGLSVASGIAPFRGQEDAVWHRTVYEWGTREKFLEDPLLWYNTFWLKHFDESKAGDYFPNAGHDTIGAICNAFPESTFVITQNVDRLHIQGTCPVPDEQFIEIHGAVGAYKCHADGCSFATTETYPSKLHIQTCTKGSAQSFIESEDHLPKCPACDQIMLPNCLLFDEDYNSHDSYQFLKAERWIQEADVLVFVGTSFAVQITNIALQAANAPALKNQKLVFNFNLAPESIPPTKVNRLQVRNVVGKASPTLKMLSEILGLETKRQVNPPNEETPESKQVSKSPATEQGDQLLNNPQPLVNDVKKETRGSDSPRELDHTSRRPAQNSS